jgi:putative hydrolase of the HAD superfamily
MRAAHADVVLFDLGGVLVRLGGVARMQKLTGIDSEDEIWRRWLGCPWVRRFERGECSADEFAAGMVTDWRLPIDPGAFIDEFRAWPQGLFDGAAELVATVRARVRVGCLSNTNTLHWHDQGTRWGLAALFDVTFLSHDLGRLKPDREVFDYVSTELGTPPQRIVFLDDVAINVAQAHSLGFVARQVRGVDEARAALVDLGLV